MTRLRAALHAACVLAGLIAILAIVGILAFPHPGRIAAALSAVIFATGAAGSVLAPDRTRRTPAPAEGSES